jgi:hypothetical protein
MITHLASKHNHFMLAVLFESIDYRLSYIASSSNDGDDNHDVSWDIAGGYLGEGQVNM